MSSTSKYQLIYRVVRRIPTGRVSTYGRVADLAGLPGHARLVGYALHAVPDHSAVPWHRVVNALGGISTRRSEPGGAVVQRLRLEKEGVEFDLRGRVPLQRFGWRPREPRREPRDETGTPGPGTGRAAPRRSRRRTPDIRGA
jgi:methylated-DNA-protein-cysteine methyltransferase-like protein